MYTFAFMCAGVDSCSNVTEQWAMCLVSQTVCDTWTNIFNASMSTAWKDCYADAM